MESISDISLVAQVAVFHNRRAFDQLVRKYQSPVRRFLLNLTLGNEALSDDLAQDTFLKVRRQNSLLPLPPGKARGWDSLSISTPPLPSSRKTSVRVSPSNSSKAIPSTR